MQVGIFVASYSEAKKEFNRLAHGFYTMDMKCSSATLEVQTKKVTYRIYIVDSPTSHLKFAGMRFDDVLVSFNVNSDYTLNIFTKVR